MYVFTLNCKFVWYAKVLYSRVSECAHHAELNCALWKVFSCAFWCIVSTHVTQYPRKNTIKHVYGPIQYNTLYLCTKISEAKPKQLEGKNKHRITCQTLCLVPGRMWIYTFTVKKECLAACRASCVLVLYRKIIHHNGLCTINVCILQSVWSGKCSNIISKTIM